LRAKGYPIPLSKKSRVRLITYRQCANHHFEKTSAPLKRKYFMNFFLSSYADYYGGLRVSIRRADSTSCHCIAKAAAAFSGCEVDSVGTRNPARPLHTKYGMLSLRPFAAPTVSKFSAI
jgi:hypothetical protein